MGDMRDEFQALKECLKEEKQWNQYKHAPEWQTILDKHAHQQFNDDHYRIGNWDFWITTGRFRNIKTGEKGLGVQRFLKKLGVN